MFLYGCLVACQVVLVGVAVQDAFAVCVGQFGQAAFFVVGVVGLDSVREGLLGESAFFVVGVGDGSVFVCQS